jgi:phosphoserine phosphatase
MTGPPTPPATWTGFRSIVFDCDSTLTSIEGVDELAADRADEIRALTDAAMDGAIPLEQVYGRRLEVIQPHRAALEGLGRLYVERLVEDARDTVAALIWLGKEVRVISGGLLPAVAALSDALGLPRTAVEAVDIRFADDGSYERFDDASPLARSGGKPLVIQQWALPRPAILVGDGATDLEAKPAVDLFVAYMGVVFREQVAAGADVVLHEASLAPVLALAADEADRARLAASRWAGLLTRADELLRRARES